MFSIVADIRVAKALGRRLMSLKPVTVTKTKTKTAQKAAIAKPSASQPDIATRPMNAREHELLKASKATPQGEPVFSLVKKRPK